jgi:hypothetical protein
MSRVGPHVILLLFKLQLINLLQQLQWKKVVVYMLIIYSNYGMDVVGKR